MKESLDGLDGRHTFQQHVRADDIVVGEGIRVAKTQIHMRLRREVEDGINLVGSQAPQDIGIFCEIAVEELEIRATFEHSRIVQRTAVVELVEADDVVGVRIFGHQMTDEP